ncbi:MAG TPA: saccharopine dehydrogenase NADP-binding domain-containing protein [Caulobacteraceae bacterium]|jgi:short subunit dehydrogenase-like uncharacterized protein|nr:saccharopine dehydrogenase NADP-binding domain-containing protein [Caulobacteraceae bacterium]
MDEIWILGATGRSGAPVARALAAGGLPVVLVGRDAARLEAVAGPLGGRGRSVLAGSVEAAAEALAASGARVAFNTVGPFVHTAAMLARALPAGCHYLDLSNELPATLDILAMDAAAREDGRCLVTGAGWGVLSTESVVLSLCAGRPAARSVRVDNRPAMAGAGGGVVGEALAGSIMEGFPFGGRQYSGGRLVRMRLGSGHRELTLPDGEKAGFVALPSGELEAARRASGAAEAVAATSELPTGALVRALLPAVAMAMSVGPLRRAATRRLAAASIPAPAQPAAASFAHAEVVWPDGTRREGWLQAGDAVDFTLAVATEVAARLFAGQGRRGAFTPGALFGPELAVLAGGRFILRQDAAPPA